MEITATFYNTDGVADAARHLTQRGATIVGFSDFEFVHHVPPSRGIRQDGFDDLGIVIRFVTSRLGNLDRELTQNFRAGAVTLGEFQPRQ